VSIAAGQSTAADIRCKESSYPYVPARLDPSMRLPVLLALAAMACRPATDEEPQNALAEASPEAPAAAVMSLADSPAKKPDPSLKKFVVAKDLAPGLAEFVAALPRKGALWAGKLEGNGGRDTIVFVPPNPRADASFRFVYHFHGTYSENVNRQLPGMKKKDWVGWDRLAQAIEGATALQAEREYNVVLVYPISAGKRIEPEHKGWSNKAYDRMWMDPAKPPRYRDSFDELHEETLAILHESFGIDPKRTKGRVLVEGHSAGGIALLNIARNGSKYVGDYLFQDASFQGWGDATWYALQERKSKARMTIVMTNNGMVDPFGKWDPWCTRLEKEAASNPEEWDEYKEWCEMMENEMKGVDNVYLHRTKVPHGKQPLHFLGGRDLPDAWHAKLK
jgi:pimeloyl-ACP methyl ester carboxylesterase